MKLIEKRVFLFDAFGTLFKASEIGPELNEIAGEKASSLVHTWRRKQLEYTWLRNLMMELSGSLYPEAAG